MLHKVALLLLKRLELAVQPVLATTFEGFLMQLRVGDTMISLHGLLPLLTPMIISHPGCMRLYLTRHLRSAASPVSYVEQRLERQTRLCWRSRDHEESIPAPGDR
jgi:hypothetical protein